MAATSERVIVSDRELNDAADAFWCLDAQTGKELWNVVIPAAGHFDFGNSTRSTPLIDGPFVYLTSAFGPIRCVKLSDGETVWERDLHADFPPHAEPPWGYCASPLIVEGKLIVNPGAADASLVALDAKTGAVVWKSPGAASAYGSFISGRFGGRLQVVGHDADSLGGWDVKTGGRLWRLPHRGSKEFGVPTPVAFGDRLLISTESEGTRLYRFAPGGSLDPRAIGVNEDLAPDSHTPIVAGNRVFGVWNDLFCLDLSKGLKPIWRSEDNAYSGYASLIGSPDRALVVGLNGELLLVETHGEKPHILGRTRVFDNDHGVYSHPALVGTRLFIRGSSEIVCINLVQG